MSDSPSIAPSTAAAVGSPMSAQQVLDREFLEIRARILKIAASLDRIERSAEPPADPARMALIRAGLELLLKDSPERAKNVQLLFSLPYQPDWPTMLGVPVAQKD